MCICAAEIQMCTYACRVRASLALDTGERTRRPCYNVFTSLAKNASAKSFDVCQLDEIEHRYERKWPQRLLCARANFKHYFLTWPSPVRSCLAHAASCWLRSPCNTILNTNLQERLVMSNDSPSGRQQMEHLLVNLLTLLAEGRLARLMQKSMLRRYIVCSWHHW